MAIGKRGITRLVVLLRKSSLELDNVIFKQC